MRKKLKKAFIPHEANDYKPSLFEYTGISIVLSLGIIFFISSMAVNRFVVNTNQGAAVYASVLVDLTNKVRLEKNITELKISEALTNAATLKAEDMASKQYFAHTSPDGTTPWYWFQKANYNFVFAGENLAVDFTESEDVENAWLASPKHNENIVDSRFTEIGIATKTGTWQGRQTTFVVQLFGTPAITSVANQTAVNKPQNQEPKRDAIRIVSENPATILGVNETVLASEISQNNLAQNKISQNNQTLKSPENEISQNENSNSSLPEVLIPSPKASLLDRALVRIPNVSNFAIMALAIMVLLGLVLFVFIEIRRQHPKRVLLGAIVFIFLSTLAYTSQAFILPM